MDAQALSKNDLAPQNNQQNLTNTGHTGHCIERSMYKHINASDAFKTKQEFVLSFDNPAHQRRRT